MDLIERMASEMTAERWERLEQRLTAMEQTPPETWPAGWHLAMTMLRLHQMEQSEAAALRAKGE
jgi:hypothetical protein